MNLTLAITSYNRYELLKQSFEQVIDDPRITEILILDDCSEMVIFEKVMSLMDLSPKVRVMRQAQNRKMQQNKADAVAHSKNEWVILLDSDNIIYPEYISALPEELFQDTIYMPDFARPEFSFKQYSGLLIDRVNVGNYIRDPAFSVLLNCCNYLVHRDEYARVYKHNPDIDGADTVYFAHRWLKAGNNFFVVPDMEYMHRIHKGSGFMANVNKNMTDAEFIKKQIASL